MDDDIANKYSLNGFVDFSSRFGDFDVVWTITGFFIMAGTLISYQPQNIAILYARSNFGINAFMTFITNIGQGLVFFNIIALHAADFIGLFQRCPDDPKHSIKVIATFLTVINMSLDWYTYKFVFILNFIFVDICPRKKRNSKKITIDKILSRTLFGISMLVEHIMMAVYCIIICFYGLQEKQIRNFAKVASILSSCAFSVQYLPQMATTCFLKDRGSYSLVTLTIILVGTSVNFCFLTFGQGENWSTVLPVGVTIIEQLSLFIICIYVIIYRKRKKIADDQRLLNDNKYLDSNAERENNLNSYPATTSTTNSNYTDVANNSNDA